MEEDDSAYPALLERELHSLHRNVPALRRQGVDTNAIRQVKKPSLEYIKLYKFEYFFLWINYSTFTLMVAGVG